ncbi:Respiratory burst oxidase2 [Citrus sinensis]|uniref:Respiratory burst oxidase2 n=1 Tax=Citrus sinensis TaxID=2711 RepID=A0ACB8LX74_CITSI|nr:Respiratory burst oxidase2 [Citrus sinensis]
MHAESQETTLSSCSSSSSSSSSPSCSACVVPLAFSPVQGTVTVPFSAGWNRRYRDASGENLITGLEIIPLRFTNLEWTDVEARFDRLAYTKNGTEPVIKWSDFSFCIAMQQTPEFANEILRALRGRSEWKVDITKNELRDYWHRMAGSVDSRIQLFFYMCDRNFDGKIDEIDMKQTILGSASANKLSMTHEEAQEYAASIMEFLDTKKRGYLEPPQLDTLFKVSLPRASYGRSSPTPDDLYHEPMSKNEVRFRSYWRRAWIVLFWLLICAVLFTWKFIQYSHRPAFQVMGYCLSTAKGAAETLKLNMALILLPVSRNTVTWLRKKRWLSSIIPFNDNINFHKLIACGIVVGVILHGGTHLACDFPRISGCDSVLFQQTLASGFGYQQPTYMQILATKEVATGIAMVILMAIAFPLATKWARRQSTLLPRSVRHVAGYNTFWYSHHLFVFVYALLFVHGMFLFLTNNPFEKTTWMYVAVPVLLYAGERIYRVVRSGIYEIKNLTPSLYPGKVLSLKMQKPEGFRYRAGMYMFVQCPEISPFEWHPFSLTSGPADDFLSVHIRALGDWTYRLYGIFQEEMLGAAKGFPKVYIDGPYGASSQDYVKYDVVLLIGLGIGATPFISIIRDVANNAQKAEFDQVAGSVCKIPKGPLKAYLYWVTREQISFEWFRDVITEISKIYLKQPVIEMHNFLSSVYQEGDGRSAILSVIQALHYARTGIDIISKTPMWTHYSRPDWFNVFSKLARRHPGERIGVFYCGSLLLGKELEGLCTTFSYRTNTRFVFHKEHF